MHNIHYIAVKAMDAEEAIEVARDILDGWGDEDNYYSIIGAVDEDNNITQGENNRWEMGSLEDIKKSLESVLEEPPYQDYEERFEPGSRMWKYAKFKNAEWEYYTHIEHPPFDIWRDSIYNYHFNEVGITNLIDTSECSGCKKYIVAIDMHS